MADLTPKTRSESFLNGEDLEPITRREHFYAGRENDLPEGHQEPETREEWFIQKYREAGDVTVESLSITENGTYTAPSGKAYSPVSVDVPLPSNAYLLKSIEHEQVATFTDGTDNFLKSLEIAIEPQQEGSGEPSPTNIRPISGWDEVNVSVCGKNLVNISDKTMTSSGYVFVISGLNIRKGIYTFSAKTTTSASMSIAVYGNGVAFINTGFNGKSISFTATDTITDIRLYTSGAGTYEEMMLEIGSTSTTYEPYNGQTITIDLDGTRYGGKVDLVSGVLTVLEKGVDLGTLNWTTLASGRHSAFISDGKFAPTNTDIANALSSQYKVTSATDLPNIDSSFCYGANGVANLLVNDSRYNGEDATAFKAHMNGVQLVYELATPTTIQLTPTAIKSLQGDNNVFASTGEVIKLQYWGR